MPAVARTAPDRPAVCCGRDVITYAVLDGWSAGIATDLLDKGVRRGDRVGVVAEPSIAGIAVILGILRAGAAYVPVASSEPDRAIARVFADARVAAAVTTDRVAGRSLGVELVREARSRDTSVLGDAPAVAVAETDPAYLIYTSGTSGEPKGVVVEHRQLAASTRARRRVYPGDSTFLLLSPLAFDSSVAGIWGTLTTGSRLVVATVDEVRDPTRLVDLVETQRVTRLLCVPALYDALLDAAEQSGLDRLRSLETVIVAGDELRDSLLRRHFDLHRGPVALVNEYGPTEATVWASFRRFEGPAHVTIGRPIPGARLYVLDDELRPVEAGVEGELFIGGDGVARGYFDRPDLTARAFLPDPYAEVEGARMYRTGDRVAWNADGELDFLGRRDSQVKIRGRRVELGAVEAALRELRGIRDAAVVPNGDRTSLVAFVCADGDADADVASVRSRLAEHLSDAMIPSAVRVLDELPLTPNGKLDRRKLAAAADEREHAPAASCAAPPARAPAAADAALPLVSAAWSEILGIRDVPEQVNFFDLGGHSLAMFELRDALEARTGVSLSVIALYRHTTVRAQADVVRERMRESGISAPVGRAATAPPTRVDEEHSNKALALWRPLAAPAARLVCFPHAGGSASFFRAWADQLPATEVHAVRYPGRAERISEAPPTDLRDLARDIAATVARLATRPLALFGHSMGAVVALETARFLEARGVVVSHLFASGSRDAAIEAAPEPAALDGDADALAERLVQLGGTDPALAADPMFRDLVLPYVEADGRMFHSYELDVEPALACPITTIVGDRDLDADIRPWSALTRSTVRHVEAHGDHFYLTSSPPYGVIRDELELAHAGARHAN